MGRKSTIIWAVLGVFAATAPPLLEHLKTTPLGTGFDCGLSMYVEPYPAPDESTFCFKVDDATTYFFYVKLKNCAPSAIRCTAEFTGKELSCEPSDDIDYAGCFEIREKPLQSGGHLEKFMWHSGDIVRLHVPVRSLGEDSVEAWYLAPDNHTRDSSVYAQRRGKYEWTYWIPCAVAFACAIVTAVQPTKAEGPVRPRLDAPSCVQWLIDDLAMPGDEQTKTRIRQLLQAAAAGANFSTSLTSMGLDPVSRAKTQILATAALDNLSGILHRLILDLEARQKLIVKPKRSG